MKHTSRLIVCLVAFLAGCHVGSSIPETTINASGEIVVSLFNDGLEANAKSELQVAMDEFNVQNAGKIELLPTESANNADLVISSLSTALSFQRNGQALEIDAPGAILGTMPLALQGYVLYYNPRLFQECGFDTPGRTWVEFFAMAQKIQQETTVPGFAIKDGDIGKHLEIVFWQNDIHFTDPLARTAAFNSEDAIQCLSLLHAGVEQGYVNASPASDSSLTTSEFREGKVASFIGTPEDEPWLPTDTGIALLPSGTDSRQVFQGIVISVMKSNDERQQAAQSAMEYLSSPQVSGRLCAAGKYTSPFKEATQNENYQVTRQTDMALSILEKAREESVVAFASNEDAIAIYQLENAWKDIMQGSDIAQSLSSAESLTNYALSEN